jgi:predicted nucleotidyltransferase
MTKEQILTTLSRIKPDVTREYKAEIVGLFGSWARNEQAINSDIDILVNFQKGATLLDLSGIVIYLKELFKTKVDVVSESSLRDELKGFVYKDLMRI